MDWISEVTECSKSCWVVVHLYQDYITHCGLVEEAITSLANSFPSIKFIKIRSTQAVENWPDRNLPTIFVYNEGELKHQMLTIKSIGGDQMRRENLEWWLAENNIVNTELESNPLFNSSRVSVQKCYGKHSTQTASVYDDEDYNDDDI